MFTLLVLVKMAAVKVFLIYPSVAITVLLSPTDPCGSEGWASSSSDEPALDDSSSLSASIHSFGLGLKNTPVLNFVNYSVWKSRDEECETATRLTPLAGSPEHCEPRPLHLCPACTGSS